MPAQFAWIGAAFAVGAALALALSPRYEMAQVGKTEHGVGVIVILDRWSGDARVCVAYEQRLACGTTD